MATLQEQMAGPSRPRFTGWLTMAPEVDPPRPSSDPLPAAAAAPPQSQPSASSDPPSPIRFDAQPAASTHGFGYLGQQAKLPQRKKRRATFQVGSPGLSEDDAGSSSRASSDTPDFDVRASFAPMPVYGKKPAAQLSTYRGVGDQSSAAFTHQAGAAGPRAPAANTVMDSSSDEEADGLSFGGRRWKGKTVHAVEQELEALRDERLMSHAPDAAYLASRLEGVRRNLEIEERRPSYVPYDEDMLTDEEVEAALAPEASEVVRQLYPFQPADNNAGVAPPLAHRPVSNASSVSLVEGETPHDLDFGLQFEPASYADVKVHDASEVSMPPISDLSSAKTIDPAARAAALDARIDIRPLRRGDLEQVRDLHAFHGDSDRAPDHGETYASTASFLLRLLVDDRHVCLVAVAKPIPEPATPLPGTTTFTHAASTPDASGLASLHIGPSSDDDDSTAGSSASSPRALSVFSTTPTEKHTAPVAPHTTMISPRDKLGRINNTPATSVFSDIFAERGAVKRFTLDDLPGPTEVAPVKKVLSIPPARPLGGEQRVVESETILGVVSAQLSMVVAASEDSLFSTPPVRKEEEAVSLVDVHLLTLATAPEERGQGLGAKLLASLHGECMVRARLMALKMRAKRSIATAGPLPSVRGMSPRFVDLPLPDPALPTLVAGTSLASLRNPHPARGKFLARTFLEVHPSNVHALQLYRAHGFAAPHDDAKAVKRGFYRGDVRIASSERTKRGGTDAWVLQRFDGALET
ncbi:Acyl-CoA N-acyltransferase [Kalmanozyma brasiliensis GHG001]|uniref:Uncharacterized protein n=1 Tax=Kalmanozyma brasiliensis (strain GHG001) TaxID=1365824 RepID=V5EDF3_KALBG|nr:Acyl-CoA N-acyltransferase [Kalmanozyma brasiliensis GHG001]EST08516.1 Acyl-CoA N-acyltransferase [Kalmanozyma brasiliensis GHG001]